MKHARTASTPFAILGLLGLEPLSGYDIRRAMERALSHFWSESYGQIYPALARLEAQRLVRRLETGGAERGRGGRRVYALTPRGRVALRAWRRRPPATRPFRDELLLKLFVSPRAAARDVLPHVRSLKQAERGRLAEYATLRRRIRREADPASRAAWLATLRFGELRSRAALAWCDETLRRLGRPA